MNALVPTQTIEQICHFRNAAIRKYEEAFDVLVQAEEAVKEARALWNAAAPGTSGSWSDSTEEIKQFFRAINVPSKELYLRVARRLIDVTVWTRVIDVAGIEQLMDVEAKKKLRDQMRYVPERTDRNGQIINQDEIDRMLPPVSVDNIVATLESFQRDAEMIFRRGIVNVFTSLDRRFRSHDGFKVGSRLIINHLVSGDGHFSAYGYRTDTLLDIERTFLIIDGKTARASYAGIVGKIETDRRGMWRPHQSEHHGDYFKVRIFKNGNAHLWFTRDDLVEKVNKILADHYGEVLGDGMTKEEDPLQNVKTTPARYFGFFPTPDAAADAAISYARLLRGKDKPQLRVLEPSAGTGNLARRCISRISDLDNWSGGRERYAKEYRFDNLVDCIEIQPHLAHQLEASHLYNKVTCADFLKVDPDPARLYDIVILNPPFDRERDIDHVMHALKFLKPDGRLVAIMSAGTEFRETKKAIAFRALMESKGAEWNDLPPGSFAESGTYVNTGILAVSMDGTKASSRYSRPTWPIT